MWEKILWTLHPSEEKRQQRFLKEPTPSVYQLKYCSLSANLILALGNRVGPGQQARHQVL